MELSLNRLPWYGQIGAFVVVCAGAVLGFWHFCVTEMQADIAARQTRLAALRSDIAKGVATARRLPEFQEQVHALEERLDSLRAVLPEEKDVAEILRRIEALATQSNLKVQRFTPKDAVAQSLYAEVPYRLQAEGTYHNLGYFFEHISKFPRIINIGEISIRAKNTPGSAATVVAECTATTFVLRDPATMPKKGAAVPKQPSLKK